MQLGRRDEPRDFREVGRETPAADSRGEKVGRGDAQRRAARLHPHAAAEPDRISFFPDLAGQRAMHGRHDLHIVPGHVLRPPLAPRRAPKPIVMNSRCCGKNRNRLPARQRLGWS